MSFVPPGEPRVQDIFDQARGTQKCRIPQKVPANRNRPPVYNIRQKGEAAKQKQEIMNRFGKNSARLRLDEQGRPKSANIRTKEEAFSGRPHNSGKINRPNYPCISPKKPSALPKLTSNELHQANKIKGMIMVPVSHTTPSKGMFTTKTLSELPDQDTINKNEDQIEKFDSTKVEMEAEDSRDSILSNSEEMMSLRITWQDKMVQFEKLKQELKYRQTEILELYAQIQNTHHRMTTLGDNAVLPSVEELRIMNVTKLTPEQLLRLCSGSATGKLKGPDALCKISVAIDVQKLHNMPAKLVKACDETLLKRKEIIDWFDSLKSLNKGISMSKLSKKLNEFNAENEMMKGCLDQLKRDYAKEMEDVVEFLRKGVNDTMALQLRAEELTYELSTLNSQNVDLRKQLRNCDHLRSQSHKIKYDELQKDLKEEKTKRHFLKDRLTRTDGQLKMNQDRAEQLEGALEQSCAKNLALETTIQELREKNRQIQSDNETQLATLNESLKEHLENLEEITEARKKLELEKEELEIHLKEIVDHYNESVKNIKQDMNLNVTKLIETEEKCQKLSEDKTKLEQKIELMNTQLLQFELRYKNVSNQMIENESRLEKAVETQKELETTKKELFEVQSQVIDYKNKFATQNEIFAEMERNYKESVELNQSFKTDLLAKEEYITDLEKKSSLMEQQLQESESKMESYVEQLNSLKAHISQLQEYFGEFENLNELQEKIYNQQTQLVDMTRRNAELVESLQQKEEQLDRLNVDRSEQEARLEKREGVINVLTEKDKEQSNVIKILRHNLEARSQAEKDMNQELADKNLELETLMLDLESNKLQISNLENIILALQEQTKKATTLRKRDQDIIIMLQSKMAEYQAFQYETSRIVDSPADTFDNLIKIIEEELSSPVDPHHNNPNNQEYETPKQKNSGDRKHAHSDGSRSVSGKHSGKNVMDGYAQKMYVSHSDKQYDGDNLDRKRAITKIDTQKLKNGVNSDTYHSAPSRKSAKESSAVDHFKHPYPGRNIQNTPDYKDNKSRVKSFKLAGHRM